MSTSRSIKVKVDECNKRLQAIPEETIVVSQMQNLLKIRLLEAGLVALPALAARRFILPRFGLVVRKGVQGALLDLLIPSMYFYYYVNRDRHHLAKLIGIEEQEKAEKGSLEKRARFVNQFWSNSQYWH